MPPNQMNCIQAAQLRAYLDERLDEAHEAQVLEHLGSCSDCQSTLEDLAGDDGLWRDVREHLTMTHHPGDAVDLQDTDMRLERLVEFLAPSEQPEMLGRLGPYEVIGLIGQGSTGIVVKALEPRLNRFVAIKVLSPMYSSHGAARQRFEREGRAVAAVTHQHVVPIYAVDEFRGLPYIVMQYIAGISLQQRIDRDGPLETCEVMRIGKQVAEGLAAAHAQGIVHRDVKPANVILENTVERAIVTDFGLARVADDASVTRSGTIAGTPQYMSPEQARGAGIDARSDLFSLGSLLYAACTARAPFRADTLYGVIRRVCDSVPQPVRAINARIDPWLEAFIQKLQAKQPEDRFESASDVADRLTHKLADLQHPTRQVQRAPRRLPVPRHWSVLTAVAAVLLVAVGWWSSLGRGTAALVDDRFTEPVRTEDGALVSWRIEQSEWNSNKPAVFEQKYEKTIQLTEGDNNQFTVNADYADVTIHPSELSDRVIVTAMRRVMATSQEEAEAVLKYHDLQVGAAQNEAGSNIVATSYVDEDFAAEDRGNKLRSIAYRISLPRDYRGVNANLVRGDIQIGAMKGRIIEAKTQHGDIALGRIDGRVFAEATNGCIYLKDGASGAVDLLTVRGNIYTSRLDKSGRLRTSLGDVNLGPCEGDVSAHSSGGDVRVVGLKGQVSARAEGGDVQIQAAETPGKNCVFYATGGGNVNIKLLEDVAIELQARGTLVSDLESTEVAAGENDQSGAPWQAIERNGGGPRLRAVSTTGNVTVNVVPLAKRKQLGGSGLGGSGLGGSGLGGSGLGGSGKSLGGSGRSLGGSGLGGSGGRTPWQTIEEQEETLYTPTPGRFATIMMPRERGKAAPQLDGYTLYLPQSHGQKPGPHPIIVYLQGGYGVGGSVSAINNWGLLRLIRDENDLSSERNRLLLDTFIVIAPHIQEGDYYDHPLVVEKIIQDVAKQYGGDLERVYVTGLSRGGHGTWGLADRLPDMFAALVPIGGHAKAVRGWEELTGPAIWIAHNTGDTVLPFSGALEAVSGLESVSDIEFLRLDTLRPTGSAFMQARHLLSAPAVDSHDAWSDLYTSADLYHWLLQHRRPKGAPK